MLTSMLSPKRCEALYREATDAMGIPRIELENYEADDIMGALAEQAKAKDIDTFLITGILCCPG